MLTVIGVPWRALEMLHPLMEQQALDLLLSILRWCLWRHGRVGFCCTAVSTCRSSLMHQGLIDICWYLRIYKYCSAHFQVQAWPLIIQFLVNFSFVHPQFPLPPLPECCSRGLRCQSKMNRSERCWQLWKTLTMAQQIQTDPTTTPHKKSIWEIPEVASISTPNWQVVLRLLWMGGWGLVSSFVERDAEPDPYFVRRYLGKPRGTEARFNLKGSQCSHPYPSVRC